MMGEPVYKLVGGKNLLFVMATIQEYGPALKQCFVPLITGVGPVESAVSFSLWLAEKNATGQLPDLVVSLGSAGSRSLQQTSIYQAQSVAYRDMDASALGFDKGVTPFLDLPVKLELPVMMEGIATASLSTGANIVSGDDYRDINADMVDMESFAVMRVCQKLALPLICLRGISDGDDALREVSDWTQYLDVIDRKLAEVVNALETQIEEGRLEF